MSAGAVRPARDLPSVVMLVAQGSCRVPRVVERGRESWTVIGVDRRRWSWLIAVWRG